MKQLLLFILLVTGSMIYGQEVTHVDFDANNPNIVFNSWNTSSTFMKVTNVFPDATNASLNCGQFTAGSDNGIGIGVVDDDGVGTDGPKSVFAKPFDLTSLSYFKMKVRAQEEVTVTFHLENDPDWGNNIEATASVTAGQLNQWVELTFDFSSFTNIYMDNIVIKVDGPAWSTGDTMLFDDIIGPGLYTSPGSAYNPADAETEVSLGVNLEIATNDKFYDAGAATITDFTGKVGLRVGDINGADVPFTASINGDNNKITIDPDADLDGLTTFWYGVIDNTIYYSDASSVTGVSASFTTKEAVVGDINVMLFDYETVDTDTPFGSWGSAGFAQISNPYPDAVNGSSNVGEFTHPGGAWTSGIESDGTFDNIDFSETPYFRIKVYVDKPIELTFKLQNNPTYQQNSEIKYQISSEETNQWIELIFNFGAITTATNYNRVQLWFDGDIAGGSVAGDKYYFDDIIKSNVPPAVSNVLNPADTDTDVVQYSQLSITSNFQFRNIDDSPITDATSVVELRETNSSGALVPMMAVLSDDKSTFTIIPDAMLNTNVAYWYGIKESMIEYVENEDVVTGVSATFTTTTSAAPSTVTYGDFDGTSLFSVSESMGDPAGNYVTAADPTNGANMVQQWDKGTTWSGWERIHFQLDAPFDAAQSDVFAVRIYSPVKASMMFKVANARDDIDITAQLEMYQDVLVANQWQTLYFDVSSLADTVSLNHLFIFFPWATGTFYVDDVLGPELQGTAAVDDFNNTEFVLYPNPSSDVIYFKNVHGTKNIRILDLHARELNKYSTDASELSIRHLDSGIYFVEINGQIKKLIKK